jgi:geranylgeranyl pyrophosphate synthase
LDLLARDLLHSGGKRLRARMTLLLAEHMRIPRAHVLPWAGANELLHNASLIHDDIQDGDHWRRGRPATWVEHGTDVAISLGDYLLVKPFLLLQRIPVADTVRFQLTQWMAETVEKMALAQVEERALFSHIHPERIRVRYNAVVAGKTAALFELPVAGLTLLAGLSSSEREEWLRPFRALGQAFQILDDLKDVLGLKGKPRQGEDLREGKVSALVVSYLEHIPAEGLELACFLAGKDKSEAPFWLERFEKSGVLARTQNWLKAEWSEFENHLPTPLREIGFANDIRQWLQLDSALRREEAK